jgi:ABC-2 type transport system ATP-binding protein
MAMDILRPDSGRILVNGRPSTDADHDRVGYLPEERGLYKKMKLLEMLLFFAEIKGRRPRETKESARRWLTRFELWEKRDAKLEDLSKGNQQKVQLIAALLHDPELLVLDEPMSGLDPVNVVLVRKLLTELSHEGRTILLSTHMMGEAEKMADDIVLIHDGKAVLSGDLAGIRAAHGKNTIQLQFDGDGAFLAGLPGVAHAALETNRAELRLASGADAQKILSAALGKLAVKRFEVVEPSLEEIFIETVGGETVAAAA